MAFTPNGADQFHNRGRDIVTKLAAAMDDFRAYARVFEIRGGALAMNDASVEDDPQLGANTEEIVVLHNELRDFFAADNNQRQNVLDKYRADY